MKHWPPQLSLCKAATLRGAYHSKSHDADATKTCNQLDSLYFQLLHLWAAWRLFAHSNVLDLSTCHSPILLLDGSTTPCMLARTKPRREAFSFLTMNFRRYWHWLCLLACRYAGDGCCSVRIWMGQHVTCIRGVTRLREATQFILRVCHNALLICVMKAEHSEGLSGLDFPSLFQILYHQFVSLNR